MLHEPPAFMQAATQIPKSPGVSTVERAANPAGGGEGLNGTPVFMNRPSEVREGCRTAAPAQLILATVRFRPLD